MLLGPNARLVFVVVAAVTAAASLGCGGSDSGYGTNPPENQPPSTNPRTVAATPQLAFSPATITIQAGQAVTFQFGAVPHNVFFDPVANAPADIPGSNANTSIARTFAAAGTFPYACHIHAGMTGTVVVQ